MVELIIQEFGKEDICGSLLPGVYIVGASRSCQIQLDDPAISGQHVKFVITENSITAMDLDSSNGTFFENGDKFPANKAIELGSKATVIIGKIKLLFNASEEKIKKEKAKKDPKELAPILYVTGIPNEIRPFVQKLKKDIHKELLRRLNLKKMAISGISNEELASKATNMVREIISELKIKLPPALKLPLLEKELVQEAIGLGPLEYLLKDDEITEVMVNGPDQVFIEKNGTIFKTDAAFADNAQVLSAIERIVSPLGRRIDESSPMVDARLFDGSRVNAIIPPLSLVGPSITIRKFSRKPLTTDNLISFNSISENMIKFLSTCVALRKNILISGGTGSGKTTLLNVLSSFLPNRERIITIEDAAELQLQQEHLIRLESRPPNIEGKGEISIRDLVRNSLRMRPDRIVVGECRGGEALDMLQAMNTGHDGSLTTIHANSPRDALARLETLVLMAGFDLPLRAIREQVASAINIIVQISRNNDGSRKIMNISEITKMEGDIISMQDIFVFRQTGWSDDDKIEGVFDSTGAIPSFMEEIERNKIDLDISIFTPTSSRGGNL